MVRFSVIIPALNEEKYIGLTLKSIFRQTFKDLEVIVVVDDRTTDATVEIAEREGAKIVFCNKHTVSDGRHMGATCAEGEILFFTDADTLIPPDFLEKVNRKFMDKNVVALSGLAIPYDAPMIGKVEYLVWSLARYLLNCLGKFFPPGYYTVIRRDVYFEIGGYTEIEDQTPSSLDRKDGLLGLRLVKNARSKTVYCLDTPTFPSSRRMHKLGFLKFNLYYAYILSHLFPSVKFFRRLAYFNEKYSK
ncbi:MAG: glycosyltransferase [Candidatus Freyarchaeota archaeon]|nr:glycosyltransferase [Candidatus Jordarchaeia archaeon]